MSPEHQRVPSTAFGPQRLALGTAQLVQPYGIVRSTGSSVSESHAQARSILQLAQELNLVAVDTSPTYGRAEWVVGSSRWDGPVWTKLDPALSVVESVERSLEALKCSRIDVLFVHRMVHLRALSKRERTELQGLQGRLVGALGISAYETQDVVEAHESIGVSIVQAPVNVFDTRFEAEVSEGKLPQGLSYVARSALLQGALAEPTTAAERLRGPLAEHLTRWNQVCAALSVKPGEAALVWVLSRGFADAVIVGAEDVSQLREIASWSEGQRASEIVTSIRANNLWPLSDPRQW